MKENSHKKEEAKTVDELKEILRDELQKNMAEVSASIMRIEEERRCINKKFDDEIQELLGNDYAIITKIEVIR